MNILFLIVIYNKEVKCSTSIKSLLDISLISKHNCNTIVFNNGPKEISIESNFHKLMMETFKRVDLLQSLHNLSLSEIYNSIIMTNDFDKLVILDDDSEISEDFFKDIISNKELDLLVPQIRDSKNIDINSYPLINGMPISRANNWVVPMNKTIFSIGSGLVIDRSIKDKFYSNNMNLFDSSFSFYGVDFSFFQRLNFLRVKESNHISVMICSPLNHARAQANKEIEPWRMNEIIVDNILSIKYYSKNKIIALLSLFRFLRKYKLNVNHYKLMLKVYFNGKHPRAKR